MQCKEVELVVEQEGLAPLPEAARAHVAECRHCQGFISDLETIVSVAEKLPAEVEPPARVWVSLRNQLEREGIIREPLAADAGSSAPWWHELAKLFRSRALATVTAGLLIVVAGVLELREPGRPQSQVPASLPIEILKVSNLLNQQEVDMRNMHLSSDSPVDASLQQNLQQVDEFITDCEQHLKDTPQDDLAREYLSDAYQQKAELLSAMMDRGRSVN
jgi:hypothetical protein